MTFLRVGVVCFPRMGGSGVIALGLAAGMARRGHQVHVMSSAFPAALDHEPNLSFHKVESPDYPVFDSPPYTVALASKIIDVVRTRQLDVLHSHYAVPHACAAYLARKAVAPTALRVVTSLHGSDVLRFGVMPHYLSVTRFAVAQSDAVVVPSSFLGQEARRLLDLPERLPVEVMPNFVDTERFCPPACRNDALLDRLFGSDDKSPKPLLFHVSTFREVKRVIDVIDVLARVRQSIPARLILVGDGPERGRVEARVRELGLDAVVRFLGSSRDFVGYLQQADAFILPSAMESFGVAALEAMSAGVPVFGYSVGGLPELVTPNVGRLVEPFKVEALADAVIDSLSDPALHACLRHAARSRALENYQLESAVDEYEGYLIDLVGRTMDRADQ